MDEQEEQQAEDPLKRKMKAKRFAGLLEWIVD